MRVAGWLKPLFDRIAYRRRIWREAQRRRRKSLPYREKMSPTAAARFAAQARWGRR